MWKVPSWWQSELPCYQHDIDWNVKDATGWIVITQIFSSRSFYTLNRLPHTKYLWPCFPNRETWNIIPVCSSTRSGEILSVWWDCGLWLGRMTGFLVVQFSPENTFTLRHHDGLHQFSAAYSSVWHVSCVTSWGVFWRKCCTLPGCRYWNSVCGHVTGIKVRGKRIKCDLILFPKEVFQLRV